MEENIKKHLRLIAKLLYKVFRVLDINTYDTFINNVDSFDINELSYYSCIFLNIAVMNYPIELFLKSEFNILNKCFISRYPHIKKTNNNSLNTVKSILEGKAYGLFADYYLSVKSKEIETKSFDILVRDEEKYQFLFDLYGTGLDVLEEDNTNGCDAIVFLKDDAYLKVYFYQKNDNGDIVFYRNIAGKKIRCSYNQNVIKLGYKQDKNLLYETEELKYIDLILNGKPSDYIKALKLSDHINIKRTKDIIKEIKYEELLKDYYKKEKEVQYGLQKTRRIVVPKC